MLHISRNKSHTNWESHKVIIYQEITGEILGSANIYWCNCSEERGVPKLPLCLPCPPEDDMSLACEASGVALRVWVTFNLPSPLTRAEIQK